VLRKLAVLSDGHLKKFWPKRGLTAAAGSQDSTFLRDIKIKRLAARACPTERIAQQLGISHPTVGSST